MTHGTAPCPPTVRQRCFPFGLALLPRFPTEQNPGVTPHMSATTVAPSFHADLAAQLPILYFVMPD